MIERIYLGDGVYVQFDGFGLVLTTENGIETTNRIVLEPEVYTALVAFVARLAPQLGEVHFQDWDAAEKKLKALEHYRCKNCLRPVGEPHHAGCPVRKELTRGK